MIETDYIDFDTAVILRQKGFNEKCFKAWVVEPEVPDKPTKMWAALFMEGNTFINNDDIEAVLRVESDYFVDAYLCPLLCDVLKWLRERNMIISLTVHFETPPAEHRFKWKTFWGWTVHDGITGQLYDYGESETYEQAAHDGISVALANLKVD